MSRRAGPGLVVLVLAVALPGSAEAHLNSTGMGPIYDGALHLLTSPEDLLAALAIALLAGMRGSAHARVALLLLPGAWLAAGLAGAAFPSVALGGVVPALWLLGLGVLLALDAKLSSRALGALAGATGAWHGFLNGTGLGFSVDSITALLGLAGALFAVIALAAALAVRARADWTGIAVRVAGSWIAASGLLWLGWSLRQGAS